MRLSVKHNDPGYSEEAHHYRAFLNGAEIHHAFTADDVEGKIWKYKEGPDGKLMLNETRTELLTEMLTGKVELRRVD
jgi:hypothetical protein